jgi:CHAT domain-containing protein
MGGIYTATEKQQNALDSYNQALTISRTAGDKAAEASALIGIGNIYTTSKDWSTALNAYNQALIISQHFKNNVKETIILNQIGKVHAASGDNATAQDYYNQALTLSQQLGYQTAQANILYNQATLNRQQNNLTAAKTQIETAITIIEQLRTQIASQQLRQSYFARNQDYYQLYIDLLMQLHQQNPNKGYDALAFHASERSRARSLIELLTEANADIRQGVSPQLLEQERNLQAQLNTIEQRRVELSQTGNYSQEEINQLQQSQQKLLSEYQDLQDQIRRQSPKYAELQYPQPLTLTQVQQQLLDKDTVLLQYALGEERSYLWAITQDSITSYQLPPQSEIEKAAQSFFRFTTDSSATFDEILPTSTQLTQLILPNLEQISQKRLLIVPDGQLHYLPFSALSVNPTNYQPLLTKHQVIHLPSASTVAINRNQLTQRTPAPNTLAIIADPVFSPDDKRFNGETNPSSNGNRGTEDIAQLSLERSTATADIEKLSRLFYTRTEADTILQLLPDKSSLGIFDFDANLNQVKAPDLSEYQIIHFATHGILNREYPELSGLVVSLVDSQGNPQNGFLRLTDIFNLNLPAELVVLSACQTGSGKNIKGEGIVGLTRGFMYAGAPRIIASLWNVDDESTAELMSQFYQKYLQENLPPAEALRQAQLAMWQSNVDWRKPYYWAAFTLQGEWR